MYYFGITPRFFKDEEKTKEYTSNKINMEEHNKFIEELLKTFSFYDYIQYEKSIIIKTPEVINTKLENYRLKEKIEELNERLVLLKKDYVRLQEELIQVKEQISLEPHETIDKIKNANIYYRNQNINLLAQFNDFKREIEERDERTLEFDRIKNIDNLRDLENAHNQISELKNEINTYKEKNEKLQIRIKTEAHNIVNKEKEKDEKEKDKERKKEEKRIKKEKEQKLIAKLLKMNENKKLDSDSDSDSD